MKANLSAQEREDVYSYLDDLRESGDTNMYGAAPYVMDEFDWSRAKASAALQDWMDSFADRHPQ